MRDRRRLAARQRCSRSSPSPAIWLVNRERRRRRRPERRRRRSAVAPPPSATAGRRRRAEPVDPMGLTVDPRVPDAATATRPATARRRSSPVAGGTAATTCWSPLARPTLTARRRRPTCRHRARAPAASPTGATRHGRRTSTTAARIACPSSRDRATAAGTELVLHADAVRASSPTSPTRRSPSRSAGDARSPT